MLNSSNLVTQWMVEHLCTLLGAVVKIIKEDYVNESFFAKDLKLYGIPELAERDIVECFKVYMSLIPLTG